MLPRQEDATLRNEAGRKSPALSLDKACGLGTIQPRSAVQLASPEAAALADKEEHGLTEKRGTFFKAAH